MINIFLGLCAGVGAVVITVAVGGVVIIEVFRCWGWWENRSKRSKVEFLKPRQMDSGTENPEVEKYYTSRSS